jgi:hypothetical protein
MISTNPSMLIDNIVKHHYGGVENYSEFEQSGVQELEKY